MKKSLMLIFLFILFLIGIIGCQQENKVETQTNDFSQLNIDFKSKGAYEIVADSKGNPVFKDKERALEQALIDYKDGFDAISKEFDLEPINDLNVTYYLTYGWQLEIEDEYLKQEGISITKFLDLYENSIK